MTITKLRRCKRIIASPNYYRDRAIQMGETFGALCAEKGMSEWGSAEWMNYRKLCFRYERKRIWYERRASVWNENLDYNT